MPGVVQVRAKLKVPGENGPTTTIFWERDKFSCPSTSPASRQARMYQVHSNKSISWHVNTIAVTPKIREFCEIWELNLKAQPNKGKSKCCHLHHCYPDIIAPLKQPSELELLTPDAVLTESSLPMEKEFHPQALPGSPVANFTIILLWQEAILFSGFQATTFILAKMERHAPVGGYTGRSQTWLGKVLSMTAIWQCQSAWKQLLSSLAHGL